MCLNETTPKTVAQDFLSKTENWNQNPDATGLLVQDWGVVQLFEAFLTDWNIIVSSVNNKNGCKLTTHTNKKRNTKRRKTKGKKTLTLILN
jgi:hypothetical protein